MESPKSSPRGPSLRSSWPTFPGQFVHIATVEAFVQLTGRGWGIFLFVVPLGLGWIGLSYYVRRRAIEEA